MELCKTCGMPYKLYKPYMGEMCEYGGDHDKPKLTDPNPSSPTNVAQKLEEEKTDE